MNARFWIFWNGSMVKITLEPQEKLELKSGGPTDEGYSHTYELYEHCGERLRSEIHTYAKDCDGPIEHHGEYEVLLHDLVYLEDGEPPAWKRISATQRDVFAEAMGY